MKASNAPSPSLLQRQKTLAKPIRVDGFGFWTGQDVRFEFCPADENAGIRFIRTDRPEAPPIPARVEYRDRKPRQTSLTYGEARVDMIEHVMAALAGAGIDNAEIRIDGAEMPGLDGSALPFFEAILEAGIAEQSAERSQTIVREAFRIGDDSTGLEIAPTGEDVSLYAYRLEYPTPSDGRPNPIRPQSFEIRLTAEIFGREIAPARTFLLRSEADYLLSRGLCQRVSPKDVLVFDDDGPLENRLRFENEPARHKILDLIGDFALGGRPILGEFRATKTGHQQNADALTTILHHDTP